MVLITSTCLFLAYVIRRKCLGKKGEGLKEHDGRASATGAGSVLSPSGGAGGPGAWVRRHGKAIVGAAVVLGLASAGALVASRRTRGALLVGEAEVMVEVAGLGVGDGGAAPDASFLLPAVLAERRKEELQQQVKKEGAPPAQQQPQQQRRARDGGAGEREEEKEEEQQEQPTAAASSAAAGAAATASTPPAPPAQCPVAAVAPSCSKAQAQPQTQQAPAQATASSSGSKAWAVALGKLAGATNATSIADLVVFPSSAQPQAPPQPITAGAVWLWPRAAAARDALASAAGGDDAADVRAYVGGVVAAGVEGAAGTAAAMSTSGAAGAAAKVAFLPAPWDPVACPALPRWGCEEEEGADAHPRPFDLVILRGTAGDGGGAGAAPLRLSAGEEGAALLRALVLGAGAGEGKGKGKDAAVKAAPPPRFVAMAVPAGGPAPAAACPDACGGDGGPAVVTMRPQCAPWRLPAPAARVPLQEGVEVVVYRVDTELASVVGAWPPEGGLC